MTLWRDISWPDTVARVWARPVDGPRPTTAVLVIGTAGMALINPGRDAAAGRAVRDSLTEIPAGPEGPAAPLTDVIVTDADHVGALAAFGDVTTRGQRALLGAATPPSRPFVTAAHVGLGEVWAEIVTLPGRAEADAVVMVPQAFVVAAGDLIDAGDDALDRLHGTDIAPGWPDAVHELLQMLRRARGTAPGDRVVAGRGPITDADGVLRFGMGIDQLAHADDPGPGTPQAEGRTTLPLTD